MALGADAAASGNRAIAVGQGSSASGAASSAFGAGARATAANAVALGAGSIADQDNSVSVGRVGGERRVTNVAAGANPTDAVNLGQLDNALGNVNGSMNSLQSQLDTQEGQITGLNNLVQRQERRANGGAAVAIALGGTVLPDNALTANYGNYRGESGIGAGLALRINDYAYLNGAVGAGLSQGGVGGRVGVTVAW